MHRRLASLSIVAVNRQFKDWLRARKVEFVEEEAASHGVKEGHGRW